MQNLRNQKSTLVTDCINEITKMVSEGRFKPGDYLPSQKKLAAQLGVGTSTLRQSIQALIAMGLLESHPGMGTWVRAESKDTLRANVVMSRLGELTSRNLHEARCVVEVALTEFAAERANQADIDQIWSALNEMKQMVKNETGYAKADLKFHLAVASAAKNKFLMQFYNLIFDLLSEAIKETTKYPIVRVEGISLQEDIASAIEKHDPRSARKAAYRLMGYVAPLFDDHSPDSLEESEDS
jgi:GntR family transcriptional repressor for pyruvate dehydrogenase complex